ncbi:ZYRO0C05896p [Zygosaccharomyces rouxii]|uniref:ZYRO0C05896p n=1 Tax=Zygosaccharomyces rouxii (strain ATCC 2623 / CBS 732 / NBRC 1130 / NCYC 568 / NRRL Y-229) TaxID=559307 RepID=C5DT68_ZYGRC|nr:uncharacterized protein ZYRO0C05896g [Zygosaccharomyces rouxii]KAH9201839.1 Bul1 N terminus-domain-containing protein [Zygosaccharomyces rouxii]CAR26979.1 ZYRO0C05896p [Zygosaccharomyces rouxii]
MTVEEGIDELAHILPSFDFFNRYYLNVPAEEHESPRNLPNYEEIDRPSLHRPSLASFDSISEAGDSLKDGVGNGITNVSIDNLHKLPEVDTPFTIDIYITPNAPKFGEPLEPPNFLNEYTCGDVVHGIVVIGNNSDKPMTFEMFYVMLEGTIAVVDRTQKTRSTKNFVRMVDMSASWAQFNVEPSISRNQHCGRFDSCDNTIFGLSHTKILQPHSRHKKFFSFKIPDQLLESQCPHGMSEHFSLPPSVGVDKHRKGCNFRDLKINRQLGYGRVTSRGGPVWADDLADDDVCVNYSVKAILVGRHNKTKELVNIKQSEYSIRVIPTTFEMVSRQKMDCSSELESLIRKTESSISKLELVKRKYDEKGFVKNEDLESDVFMLKEVQLRSLSKSFDANWEKRSGTLEVGLLYKVEPKWTSKFINSPQQKAGIIIGRIRTPHVVLPYRPPILIYDRNRFEIKNKHERENALRLSQICGNALEDLEIELECNPANNSDGKPPGIKAISAELISVTGMSKRDI